MKITSDLNQAENFLSLFNYQTVTFQYLKKGKPAGFIIWDKTTHDFPKEVLEAEHTKGKEIFFMVNEGDGIIYPNKSIPRSQKNVNRLTALFIDTDDCPLSKVKAYLKCVQLKPHIVVETSPNKYHLYFFLNELPTRDHDRTGFVKALRSWKRSQNYLCHLGESTPQTDSSVKDCSRVLRVPGFLHLKNPAKPHLSRIVQQYNHPSYSLQRIETQLKEYHLQHSGNDPDRGHHQSSSYQLPTSKVGQGNRHHHITSLLGHCLNRGLDPDLALQACYRVIETKFENPKEFLPGGSRHNEITDFIKYKLEDIKQQEADEHEKKRQSIISQIPDGGNGLELEDDFYLNAPGLVGEITKEITKKAYYPLPSFAFASAVSLVSVLKGKSVKLEDGTPTTNYFLALAPTGAGKNYSKETIQHTLYGLNKNHLIESKVRSDRGILQWLNRNDGVGLLIMDEAEELLRSMENDKSSQHIRNFKTLLLELYSATNHPGLSFGEIASRKEDPIVLKHPHFSSIIMGTPNIIDSSFTKKSVTDGLFQRFNVLYSKQQRVINPQSEPSHALNGNVYSQLHDLLRLTAIAAEEGGKTIRISKGAAALKQEAQAHYDALYNEELKKESNLEGIFTRALEKALRLSVALVEGDELTPAVFEYALQFVEKNSFAMRAIADEAFNQSAISKEMRDLERFVARNGNQSGVCTYRQIIHGFKVRDSRQLRGLLQDCVDSGVLSEVSVGAGKKGGRPGKGYKLG